MRLVSVFVALALTSKVTTAQKEDAARPLDLKGVKMVYPDTTTEPRPVVITSADELAKAKAFADDAAREAVMKQVDFAKEKVVVFVWAGSGAGPAEDRSRQVPR